VYALDVKHPLLVAGTADRQLYLFNLQNPQQPYKTVASPLKWQTRVVSCFPDRTGYLVGSIEGRVAVHHVEDSVGAAKNFTFKCHRCV
jgi:mRNA export factor